MFGLVAFEVSGMIGLKKYDSRQSVLISSDKEFREERSRYKVEFKRPMLRKCKLSR